MQSFILRGESHSRSQDNGRADVIIHLYLAVQILHIFSWMTLQNSLPNRCREAAGDDFKTMGEAEKSHRAERNG
jgi:hypothetical protein